MTLMGSLLPTMAVLSTVMIVQSRALAVTDASEKIKLAKDIEKVTYRLLIPAGLAITIAGFIGWDLLKDASISVGFSLIAASVAFLVQSKSLSVSGDQAIRFAHSTKVWAWILFVGVIIGLGFLLFPFIKLVLNYLVALICWALC